MTETSPSLPPHLEGQSSWLSKTTSARFLGHPAVWLIATGLFILTGYIWLQNFSEPIPSDLNQAHANDEIIGAQKGNDWNPEIYQSISTIENMSITREADDLRADAYRNIIEQENIIQPLLGRAREYLERNQLVTDDEQNAWTSYQNILDIDPGHKLAKSGQAQILQILQGNAEIALEEKDYTSVEKWLAKLDIVRPNHIFQTDYRRRISKLIKEELAAAEIAQKESEHLRNLKSALDIAQTAMSATPANLFLAYTSFQQALRLEPNNTTARTGLRQIQNQRIALTKLAIARDDYEAAQLQIDSLQKVKTDKSIVEELELAIRLAKTRLQGSGQSASNKQADRTNKSPGTIVKNQQTRTSSFNTANIEPDTPIAVQSSEQSNDTKITASNSDPSPFEQKITTASRSNNIAQLSEGIKAYYSGDYITAFEKLHPLAEENSARAQFRIGIMYYRGRTVVKNIDLARQWISRALPGVIRAAENNEAWAQADLGAAYELGIGLNRDIKRAATFYQKSANQGYAGAQTNLGVLYGTGDGVEYSRKTALLWLKKAADQGDKIAIENLDILKGR